jgi:putative hydrolase of the HAD superfamily
MSAGLDIVFLDVGGPIYDEGPFARALLAALRELGADVDEVEFRREYDCARQAQARIRPRLAERFLGPDADVAELSARAKRHWRYPPEALHADVVPCLEQLSERYRIGLLANQPEATRAALVRDGVAPFVDLWVVSDEVGFEEPDPRIFAYALEKAGCEPSEAAFVGDRLDVDMRPAKRAGLRTVWLLRGEAPPEPTREQLAEPDVAIGSLRELPLALERLAA